jgi:hypothetical protein
MLDNNYGIFHADNVGAATSEKLHSDGWRCPRWITPGPRFRGGQSAGNICKVISLC